MSKAVTGFLCFCCWLHGATVGVAMGEAVDLYRFFAWTFGAVTIISMMWMHSPEIKRIAASFIFLLFTAYLASFVKSIAWFRTPKLKQWTALPDVGHDLLGESFLSAPFIYLPLVGHIDCKILPNLFLIALVIATSIFVGLHPMKDVILRRVLMIYSALMLARVITAVSTYLPDSNRHCHGIEKVELLNIREVVRKMLQSLVPAVIGDGSGCRDIIFQGHTIILILCAMTWHTYYKWVPSVVNQVKALIWACVFFVILLSLAQKQNYTLDVILGLYFSVTTWATYHRLANDVITGHRFSSVWLIDKALVYPMIEWMEATVLHERAHEEKESTVRLYRRESGLSSPNRRSKRVKGAAVFRTSDL